MFRKLTRKWTRLKLFVMASETNMFRVYYITSRMALSIIYDLLISSLSQPNEKLVGKNLFEVGYQLNDKPYKMIVRNRRGPCPISFITDELGIDITDHIIPYMGPFYDWHGYEPPASTFGYKEINITYTNGNSRKIK